MNEWKIINSVRYDSFAARDFFHFLLLHPNWYMAFVIIIAIRLYFFTVDFFHNIDKSVHIGKSLCLFSAFIWFIRAQVGTCDTDWILLVHYSQFTEKNAFLILLYFRCEISNIKRKEFRWPFDFGAKNWSFFSISYYWWIFNMNWNFKWIIGNDHFMDFKFSINSNFVHCKLYLAIWKFRYKISHLLWSWFKKTTADK